MQLSKPIKDIFKNKQTAWPFFLYCILSLFARISEALLRGVVDANKNLSPWVTPEFWYGLILSSIIDSIVLGFLIKYAHNEITNQEECMPVFWKNNFDYFKKGFIYSFGLSILFIIFIFILEILAISEKVPILNIIALTIGIILLLFFLISIPLFFASYAEKYSIQSVYFNFEEIFLAFKYSPKNILITALFSSISLIFVGISTYFSHSLLLLGLIAVFCSPFLMFYCVNLWAQTWKKFKEKYNLVKGNT